MFRYVACGLPNIYLVNGYHEEQGPGDTKTFRIDNLKGLHKAIGIDLVRKDAALDGDEFRFLRTEMLMSRRTLGQLLDYSPETLKKWESGENSIHKLADTSIRKLYADFIKDDSKLRGFIDLLNELDKTIPRSKVSFEETGQGWIKRSCA